MSLVGFGWPPACRNHNLRRIVQAGTPRANLPLPAYVWLNARPDMEFWNFSARLGASVEKSHARLTFRNANSPRNSPVASASAFLQGSGFGRIPPALGAAARPQGLLRHGEVAG